VPTGSYALLLAEQVLGTQVYHVVPLGSVVHKGPILAASSLSKQQTRHERAITPPA